MSEPTHREILTAIDGIKRAMDTHEKYNAERRGITDKKLDSIDRRLGEHGNRLRKVEDVANMGRGAWWAILKIGGLLTLAAGAAAWVWNQIKIPH
jgi:hypothetical protein